MELLFAIIQYDLLSIVPFIPFFLLIILITYCDATSRNRHKHPVHRDNLPRN